MNLTTKKLKNQGKYLNLVTFDGEPVYCIHKSAVSAIVPDQLGQPMAIEIPTQSTLCGSHCPFFHYQNSTLHTCLKTIDNLQFISESSNLKLT